MFVALLRDCVLVSFSLLDRLYVCRFSSGYSCSQVCIDRCQNHVTSTQGRCTTTMPDVFSQFIVLVLPSLVVIGRAHKFAISKHALFYINLKYIPPSSAIDDIPM